MDVKPHNATKEWGGDQLRICAECKLTCLASKQGGVIVQDEAGEGVLSDALPIYESYQHKMSALQVQRKLWVAFVLKLSRGPVDIDFKATPSHKQHDTFSE
ncbi:uncharacterized protein PAN0_021c6024 [Moesziomyces antarcticus]|uniref:Uncharacterized protein n=2 Tax=Pseudozyma antarctica TaxID=84753 RepID=A0A5C3FXQ6_PSEA2|nr:uncharacterized protein PAN0_021c6024 [Moesziomyces antarcticus]GAK67795.1 hypothetical protein PAN0_021c6024 [Moesziomyces antarcticus]SPO48966.1 uncharacterized protein PSANT_06657 [Moesziomyces antarcticus]